tara:strand:+ start:5138 stop:6154 length:1017 start_codon:yes stop_codon:yes gene_type:complete
MSGYYIADIQGTSYKICNPSVDVKLRASQLYDESMDSTRFESWLTDRGAKALLVETGFVSQDVDSNFPIIEKSIEELKIQLYESAYQFKEREKIRKRLNAVKQKYEEMYAYRHMFDMATREGHASLLKTQYLIAASTFTSDGKSLGDDIFSMDFSLIDALVRKTSANKIDVLQFRKIARTDPWRSYWGAKKEDVFGLPAMLLSDDQRYLILMSKMYDNCYEHPESPPEDIVEDDDLFDGWMLVQKKKREEEKNSSLGDDMTKGRHSNAQEIFLPVANREEAKKIEDLNTLEGRMVKKQRAEFLKKNQGKEFSQSKLPDEAVRIHAEHQRQFLDKVKGK